MAKVESKCNSEPVWLCRGWNAVYSDQEVPIYVEKNAFSLQVSNLVHPCVVITS